MSNRVTLQKALETWAVSSTVAAADRDVHIPHGELYEFLLQTLEPRQRGDILDHLSHCSVCLRDLKEIADCIEEVDSWPFETYDSTFLRAAASAESADAFQSPQKLTTNDGIYIIDIRRYLGNDNRGVITVQVADPYRSLLEGKTVYVRDDAGRLLLQGQVQDGEVSKEIEKLDQIAMRIHVRAD